MGLGFSPLTALCDVWAKRRRCYTVTMAKPPRIGLFPGSFDPITNGHLDVIGRGQALFDKLIVAVAQNPGKRALFSTAERLEMIETILEQEHSGVAVQVYDGLTVDFAKHIGATAILRGLRNVTDLTFEFQLALTNRAVADIETVFIMTGERYGFTSSTLIKQIASAGNIDRLNLMLPAVVIDRLKNKKQELKDLVGDDLTA
jgi:pantetheine-phosphate adenylyltransferase